MPTCFPRRAAVVLVVTSLFVQGQQPPPPPPKVVPPPGFGPRVTQAPKPEPAEAAPPQQQPATPAPKPQAQAAPTGTSLGGLNLQNVSLTEVIDYLARQLKINYILDPRVGKSGVTLNTYGETKEIDPRALLDTILRINGAAMVQVGDIYRIVPLPDVQRLPLKPQVNQTSIPEDDRPMLNLIFLKYADVLELVKLIDQFLGEGAKSWAYPQANLLLILDSGRNMRRTMELIALFDNQEFAAQRVRLFEVENSRPSDLAEELEGIFKAISLNEKTSPVKFLPLDRINLLVGIAPNPEVFKEVETWLKKLDVAVTVTAGSIDNYVYRVKYGRAEMLAGAIMMLYGGPGYGYGAGMYGGGMHGGGMYGGGMYGGGMYGGGMYGGRMYGGGMYGAGPGAGPIYGGGVPAQGPITFGPTPQQPLLSTTPAPAATAGIPPANVAGPNGQQDLTGQYLGAAGYGQMGRIPRVVPNPLDNSLLIQATPQEYEGILKLLRELDVSPRQVLIEAKIYEVSLTGAFSAGVSAFLQQRGAGGSTALSRQLLGAIGPAGVNLTIGTLVGQSRQLLAEVVAQESTGRSRVISAPSIIATDSIAASINVGIEVPTLTSTASTGLQQEGSSIFTNSVSNRNTGVTLSIVARVNPSGIVTLVINQEVSAPQPPASNAAIQSPSFSKRTVQTQVTVNDGDTIAIGGIINEDSTSLSAGVPVLHRIPGLGLLFGEKRYDRSRTELIVFMTPRVIYDTNQITEASEELKSRMQRLRQYVQE